MKRKYDSLYDPYLNTNGTCEGIQFQHVVPKIKLTALAIQASLARKPSTLHKNHPQENLQKAYLQKLIALVVPFTKLSSKSSYG